MRRARVDFRTDSGLTLIEVVFAAILLSTVLVVGGRSFLDFSRAFSSLTKLMHGKTRAQIVMNRLVAELTTGSFTTLAPAVPAASDNVEFQRVTGVMNGDPVLGNPIHIELVPLEMNPSDGIDNDGNGLIDECGIRIWEDFPPYGPTPTGADSPVIICSKVQKGGLQFTREGAMLLIEMTVMELIERGDAPKTIRLRSGVKMRNK